MSAAWAVWAWLSSCCCPPVVCPQLYELDADPKRKEFLDDLFSFMQKRGEHSQGEGAALQILQLAPALPPPPVTLLEGGTGWVWVITVFMF